MICSGGLSLLFRSVGGGGCGRAPNTTPKPIRRPEIGDLSWSHVGGPFELEEDVENNWTATPQPGCFPQGPEVIR